MRPTRKQLKEGYIPQRDRDAPISSRAIRRKLEKDLGGYFQSEPNAATPNGVRWDMADPGRVYYSTGYATVGQDGTITFTSPPAPSDMVLTELKASDAEKPATLTVDIINKALKILGASKVPVDGREALAAAYAQFIDKQMLDAVFDFSLPNMTATEVQQRVEEARRMAEYDAGRRWRELNSISVIMEMEERPDLGCPVVTARAIANNGQEYSVQFRVELGLDDPREIESALMAMIENAFREEEERLGVLFL